MWLQVMLRKERGWNHDQPQESKKVIDTRNYTSFAARRYVASNVYMMLNNA